MTVDKICGYDIHVVPDWPKMQLSEGIKEYLTPAMIKEYNAWMLDFFGTTNLLKDGQVLQEEAAKMFHMNPRTYEQVKKTVIALSKVVR